MTANEIKEQRVEPEYLSFKQTAVRYPAFTEGSLRWLRFNGNVNGFNTVVRTIGRKCLINVQEFQDWIEQQTGTNNK